MDQPKLTKEEAINMLAKEYPKGVDLCYVQYDDKLNEEQAAEVVRTGFCDSLFEGEWVSDMEYESIEQIKKELFGDFDIEDDVDDVIREWCWDHNTSDVLGDLVKHTHSPLMYYDLGLEITSWAEGGDKVEKSAKAIARKLKIDYVTHGQKLRDLVGNASYGGDLVLLFKADLSYFYKDIHEKYVTIEGPQVCIMHRGNGSGDFTDLGISFKVRADRTRFKIDEEAPGYSINDTFGGIILGESNMKPTNDRTGVIGPAIKRITPHKETREIEFERKWKEEGKCSFGDMHITRHKSTPYRNDYPCGNKCDECGTFWID